MALYTKCCNCGEKIPYRTKRCDKCQTEWNKMREQYKDEAIKRFRNSKWWKIKAKQIMKDYHYQCQLCKHNGVNRTADEVHHIIPLSVDFEKRLDDRNLIPLCEKCHDNMDVHGGELTIPPEYGKDF